MCLYFFVYIYVVLNSFVLSSKSAYIYANVNEEMLARDTGADSS